MQEDSDSPRSDSEEGPSLSAQEELAQLVDSMVDHFEWMVEHEEDIIRTMDRIGELYEKLRQELDQSSLERRLEYFKRSKAGLQNIYFHFENMASLGCKAAQNSLPSFAQIITNAGTIIQMLEWMIQNQPEAIQMAKQIELQMNEVQEIKENSRKVDLEIKAMNEDLHNLQGSLRVILKIRPIQSQKDISQKELEEMRKNVIVKWRNICQIDLFETIPGIIPKKKWVSYRVDQAFSPNIRQEEVFRSVGYLVHKMFANESCALLCLGQTGSGKTHAMFGTEQCMKKAFLTQDSGIVPRALQEAFRIIEQERQKGKNLKLSVYFRQIYKGVPISKGSKPKFSIITQKPILVITEEETIQLENLKDALIVMSLRLKKRRVGKTVKNKFSSRSHLLICLQLREGQGMEQKGQLSFIDLAGNEAMSEQHPEESIYINSSLSELKECLRLIKKKVPQKWKDKNIVEPLRPNLENSKCILIATLSSKKQDEPQNKTSLSYAMDIMNMSN